MKIPELRICDLIAIAMMCMAMGMAIISISASRNDFPGRRQGGGTHQVEPMP